MPIVGTQRDDVLVLGGMPLQADDKAGKPFQGEASQWLLDCIPGQERHRVSYGNVIRCAGDPGGTASALHACQPHLVEDIAKGRYSAILAVGPLALQRLAPGLQVHDAYGLPFPIEIAGKSLWAMGVHDPWTVYQMQGEWNKGPMYPVFRASIKRFFQQLESWGMPQVIKPDPLDVLYPTTRDEAIEIYKAMEGPVGIDVETSQLKPYIVDARLLSAGISDGTITMAFPIDHPEQQYEWALPFLLAVASKRKWIAHNASMELVWMTWHAKRKGIAANFKDFDDTMAQARLYFERAGCSGLDNVSQIVLGTNVKRLSHVQARNIMQYPLSEVLPYNGMDAQASALIHKRLIDRVKHGPYQTILEAVRTTSTMELMGLTIDPEAASELRGTWQGQVETAEAKVRGLYEVREFEIVKGRKFSISAPADLGEALVEFGRVKLPKTPAGKQYKTDDETLSKAAADNPLARAVLDWRAANKIISTYIDPVESALTLYEDGLLHPSYTTMLVRSGRLSSNDPNIQNFPKRKHKELRRQIKARLGHVFLALDYGQLEARVIAMASRDRVFCKAILEGFDVHSFWLDECLKICPDYLERLAIETNLVGAEAKKVRKAGRDIIKTDFVFSSFFGSGATNIAGRTRIPLEDVQELHRVFWSTYSGAKDWIKDRRYEYDTLGTSRTLTGRMRFDVLTGNEPLNNPIQGTGADIVIEGMNALARLSRDTNDPYLHPRINIHDDLIFELPDDTNRIEEYMDIIMPEMVKVRHPWQIVPLMVEARIGNNWADLEEFTTYTGDYVR